MCVCVFNLLGICVTVCVYIIFNLLYVCYTIDDCTFSSRGMLASLPSLGGDTAYIVIDEVQCCLCRSVERVLPVSCRRDSVACVMCVACVTCDASLASHIYSILIRHYKAYLIYPRKVWHLPPIVMTALYLQLCLPIILRQYLSSCVVLCLYKNVTSSFIVTHLCT